ncbi:MAG: DUF5916 domain-containing protein [Planctomycetota bacterium]|nr:DUF5916 domain-containing protein [Planctomycetota bacterium]
MIRLVATLSLLIAGQPSEEDAVPPGSPGPRDPRVASPELDGSRPSIAALRVDEGPVVDGRLDDPVWQRAPVGGPLRQYEPTTGGEMTERTEFRVLYDKERLYVGVWCFDRQPEEIIARVMARDESVSRDDFVAIALDTFLDRRNGYYFRTNANGAREDALVSDNTHRNKDWDAIWAARGSIDEDGWKVEIAIPFKSLAFDPALDTWGFNISRTIARKFERGRWASPRPEVRTHHVGEAGSLTGLRDLEQGVGLDLVPYALLRHTADRANSRDFTRVEFGLDARYRITPNLLASLSYNTDFAQTEVDTRQINLTRFDLFFPEKRDFFLEDSSIFRFGGLDRFSEPRRRITGSRPPELLPFFSRRIGLSPTGEIVPILLAGKVTGRVGKYNIGVLDAVLEEHGELEMKNAFVTRISRNVLEQSSVGMIATHGDPSSDQENLLLGADAGFRTSRFLGSYILEGNAFAMGTHTEDAEDDFSPSYGFNVSFPNDLVSASLEYYEVGEEFNPALGFATRTGVRSYGSSIGYQPRPRSLDAVRQLHFIYRNRYVTDLSNDLETAINSFIPLSILFDSADQLFFQSDYEFDGPDVPFEISEGVVIPAGDYWWWSHTVGFDTARRRMVRAGLEYTFGDFYTGDRQKYVARLIFVPWKYLGLALSYSLDQVRLPEGDFDTRLAAANMQWNFTPDLAWFHFLQYDSVTESVGYNSRIQWEFRPGSLLFLVLNQNYARERGRLDLERSEVTLKLQLSIRF